MDLISEPHHNSSLSGRSIVKCSRSVLAFKLGKLFDLYLQIYTWSRSRFILVAVLRESLALGAIKLYYILK